jgi:HK97 family phage portal protein
MKKKWYQIWKRDKEDVPSLEQTGADNETITQWIGGNQSYVTSPETAMKIAAVYRCVDILSGSIASLPLQLKIKKNGVFQLVEDHNINYLLTIRANERQTSYDMMQNAVIQMVLRGNAYILQKYIGGELDELILLSPNTTSYDKYTNLYHVTDIANGIVGVFESNEIIHLKNLSLDGGYTGVSTITYAAKVMGISANADERTLDSFKPGNMLKGFISGDGDAGVRGFGEMQDNQLKDVTSRVSTEINSGKPIFHVPGQAKFNQLSISSTDLQLLDTRKFGVLDICRFMGVHPDKVFAGQSQNYKASEMSNESFLADTLQSKLRKIESEFNAKLIARSLAHKMKTEFDVESLLTMSLEQSAMYMEKTINCGVYSVNHWRAKKGQPPVEGGDQILVSCNVAPVNSEKIRGESKNLPPKTDDNTNK